MMINGSGNPFVGEDNDVGFCMNRLKNGSEVPLQIENNNFGCFLHVVCAAVERSARWEERGNPLLRSIR